MGYSVFPKYVLVFTSVFLNRWAADKFQWVSNQVILLSFTTKLYNFIVI